MEKDKSKKMKRDALKSFLEVQTTPAPQPESGISEESTRMVSQEPDDCQQVYLEDSPNCVVCFKDLDKVKMKKCGFCEMPACSEHLRKRRRKKGKFQRVCDTCQDRIIYEIYTKLEAKAEESINVEEEIVTMKHQQFFANVQQRREKRRQIGFNTMKLQQAFEQKDTEITDKENSLMSHENKVESTELSVIQLEAYVTRVSTAFKQNYEVDYSLLSQQNDRLGKQLAKAEKKCQQVRISMQKKQKQIEDAFAAWEQKEFKKKIEKEGRTAAAKKKDCAVM